MSITDESNIIVNAYDPKRAIVVAEVSIIEVMEMIILWIMLIVI